MKKGSLLLLMFARRVLARNALAQYGRAGFAVCLILFISFLAVPVFGDSSTVAMESIILDSFDGSPYKIDGVEYHYNWKAVASKFTTKTDDQVFPVLAPVTTAPQALQRQNANAKSLGLQGSFDRRGFNWVDIYPTYADGDGQPIEIPLRGRTRFIDVWVWGSNLDYTLEAYIRDNQGMIHTVLMGHLRYAGWKNLRTAVPSGLPMVSNVLPRSTHATTFVKFRVWTNPAERTYVDLSRDQNGKITKLVPFYIYFSQLKVLNDVYETVYDGDILAEPLEIEKVWSGTASAGNNE
ncbi:MAG: flagellar filament outer layer protein FlaA [Termitinemataceae bacterium]|nr:MAG: flagellar filament outer layer protein FlaA [Termitinemataceae bacterium]